MRILFIANHGCGGNQDENAVTYAFQQLGHEVIEVHEDGGYTAHREKADLCLFFKWDDPNSLAKIRCPKVFWYFDLVDFPFDPNLAGRCKNRRHWMETTLPLVDLGFCTDGDWVERHSRHNWGGWESKLVWLPQGADERYCGFGDGRRKTHDLLFTGIRKGGVTRESFVAEMRDRYGKHFAHVTHGCHQRELRNLIASSKIVVAPDGPLQGCYWSNRVYVTLGFGGFLLHPYVSNLAAQYENYKDIVYYHSREHLHQLIEHYLCHPAERDSISASGLKKTLIAHTYRHRCEQMLKTVRERLGV